MQTFTGIQLFRHRHRSPSVQSPGPPVYFSVLQLWRQLCHVCPRPYDMFRLTAPSARRARAWFLRLEHWRRLVKACGSYITQRPGRSRVRQDNARGTKSQQSTVNLISDLMNT
ncbi:hypothetical protein EVAR_40539_1 [Eumeta japonica]|uniref:Uncharacterized protein n=1 Tax=Eumeta variegata TaxID=151549 RepID=A0A4C1XXH7_EUMVA|nr:hypothetical protein EVAR_40539_1 [Eumeta japonica]